MQASVSARPYRTEPTIEIEALIDVIKQRHGLDFTGYRRASLARRVEKRMKSVGLRDVAAYHELLCACPLERAQLVDAILINVTSFFRDEASWTFLADRVLPDLLRRRGPSGRIRVWSAGCASGEEPYTLAMILAEAMGADAFKQRVTIHATDVDDDALSRGRRARYAEHQVSHLPTRLRQQYFHPVKGDYAFRPDLKRRVYFRKHCMISDVPVMHVDLLACRNTLMYLNADTQARVLQSFHRGLNEGGILFLGRAETLLTHDNAFEPIDLKRRISIKAAA